MINKSRYMNCVLYPENMIPDWELVLDDIIQVPFAYCKHNLDVDSKSEHRKDHVHMLLAFPNTTTLNHAINVANLLSVPGKLCCSTCQAAISVRSSYDYLIHDTDSCRKLGKYQYSPSDRVTGNGFDIGSYEQLALVERIRIVRELCQFIIDENFVNFSDFYIGLVLHFGEDDRYHQVLQSYSALFERLTKGNYQRLLFGQAADERSSSLRHSTHHHATTTQEPVFCCPECGSVDIFKRGKTRTGSQRFECKCCGKTFSETS